MAGLEVVTTCSPRNNDLVRSYGADHIYDVSQIEPSKAVCEMCVQVQVNTLSGTTPLMTIWSFACRRIVPFAQHGRPNPERTSWNRSRPGLHI